LEFSHETHPRSGDGSAAVGAYPRSWHHRCVRLRTLLPLTAAAGAGAALGYAGIIERNWFALRRLEIPVLPPGTGPLRILHISDTHLTPGRTRLQAWLRTLDDLEPDLVVNTGASFPPPQGIGYFLDALGPFLDRPGVLVLAPNALSAPEP